MDTFRKLIGQRIKTLRKEKGLTQEKLADKAQLTYQYVGAVERGARNISMDSLERIICALGVEFDQLLNLKEVTKNPISEDEHNKGYILTIHNHLLKPRSVQEIRAIHKITEEILKILPANIQT
ncbi:helix-turn-helix transcriptional regulator [Paenibacillus sp. GD4]|uniref:helix-turn-helix domain-containing protein n=1 Tax=Paenibacillus sp. GD4 TaxID=3068890 RepID=UPI0027964D6A|nr:helix-turn-helix transcriptional regulator [Paenibacillus sp. GD4]MDQ1910548.1 helix-turn-helix transcriptional regulator [Paenibacillus sp. GD4]